MKLKQNKLLPQAPLHDAAAICRTSSALVTRPRDYTFLPVTRRRRQRCRLFTKKGRPVGLSQTAILHLRPQIDLTQSHMSSVSIYSSIREVEKTERRRTQWNNGASAALFQSSSSIPRQKKLSLLFARLGCLSRYASLHAIHSRLPLKCPKMARQGKLQRI